jgi:hypothetical protein
MLILRTNNLRIFDLDTSDEWAFFDNADGTFSCRPLVDKEEDLKRLADKQGLPYQEIQLR